MLRCAFLIKNFYSREEEEDTLLTEIFANKPSKFLAIGFSVIGLLFITPLLYVIVIYEKVMKLLIQIHIDAILSYLKFILFMQTIIFRNMEQEK